MVYEQTGGRAFLREVKLRWRGIAAIGALIGLAVLLVGALLVSNHSARQRDIASAWERHTFEVLDATSQLRLAALYATRGERGYLITGDRAFLKTYDQSIRAVASYTGRLERLVSDRPSQIERLEEISGHLDELIGHMSGMIALEEAGRREEWVARFRTGIGRRTLDRVLIELDLFEHVERDLLEARRKTRLQSVKRDELGKYLLGGAAVILLLMGAFATLELRRSLAREESFRREMERRAATDELTGLANRRETLAALDRHISSVRRHGHPLSVAILDIDHFKRVNDTYGHPAGDEVIRRVAQFAVELMREEDLVGRLGGEEFVVILPDTDAAAALKACDRLRARIAEAIVPIGDGSAISVTLSAGVAQIHADDDRTRLIARADEALYDAKNQGRDRVLLAA